MRSSRSKVILSVAILVVGILATVLFAMIPSPTESSGMVVDFGDRQTLYTEAGPDEHPVSALSRACGSWGFELVVEGGTVVSIDGTANGDGGTWGLYAVAHGARDWTRLGSDPASHSISDYTVVCWGYCAPGELPTRAVDSTGVCFYGLDVPSRVVSMAPSCTEIVCAVDGGTWRLVGTDMYSNYPEDVVRGHGDGSISIIGGYTNPSFETIMRQEPDLVIGVGDQNMHVGVAGKLRAAGIDVIIMDGGEDVDTVLDNIFSVGVALGTESDAVNLVGSIRTSMDAVSDVLGSQPYMTDVDVMVSLSAVKSPWVSGSNTYVSDVVSDMHMHNVYSGESGWVQVNSETLLRCNPSVIIIASTDYEATQSDYDALISSLSPEWCGTDAYRTGEIYLFTGDSCDLLSRPGPRVAQMSELLARVVHGGAFDDGITVPKVIGDGYADYLTVTKEGSL